MRREECDIRSGCKRQKGPEDNSCGKYDERFYLSVRDLQAGNDGVFQTMDEDRNNCAG